MILIFGGVYQGKLDYALNRFGLAENEVFFCRDTDINAPDGTSAGKKIVYEIDKWILALVKADINVTEKIKQFASDNTEAVVICNDISCGVVPVDPVLRKWREETGRAAGYLSQCADEVVRLFCGIPARLK